MCKIYQVYYYNLVNRKIVNMCFKILDFIKVIDYCIVNGFFMKMFLIE